mgnify:CR=1 FL=1
MYYGWRSKRKLDKSECYSWITHCLFLAITRNCAEQDSGEFQVRAKFVSKICQQRIQARVVDCAVPHAPCYTEISRKTLLQWWTAWRNNRTRSWMWISWKSMLPTNLFLWHQTERPVTESWWVIFHCYIWKISEFPFFFRINVASQHHGGAIHCKIDRKVDRTLSYHWCTYHSLPNIEITSDQFENQIGVLSPYKQQLDELRTQIHRLLSKNNAVDESVIKSIEINTVDGFQGREKNIIIFSCVRAAGTG